MFSELFTQNCCIEILSDKIFSPWAVKSQFLKIAMVQASKDIYGIYAHLYISYIFMYVCIVKLIVKLDSTYTSMFPCSLGVTYSATDNWDLMCRLDIFCCFFFKIISSLCGWKLYGVALLSVRCFLSWNSETFCLSTDQSELGLEIEMTVLKLMVEICIHLCDKNSWISGIQIFSSCSF